MIRQITVTPAEDTADFRIRFCSESFSLPGISWPMEELDDVHFHHCLHQLGCSPKQIAVIVRLIDHPPTEHASVSREGVVDLFPCEEDFRAYEFETDVLEEELPFGDDSFPR